MSQRVLAFLGPEAEVGPVAAAAWRLGLTPVRAEASVQVFVDGPSAARILPEGAVVVGDIFSRSGATCQAPSDGWGNYVAFSSENGGHAVERAAMTGMPLYWARFGGGVVCSTRFELLTELLPPRSIDWESVAQNLVYSNLRSARTGLAGLSELLPGSRLRVENGVDSITSLWSPWEFAEEENALGIADLAPELERRLVACVSAWASSRSEIVLELSGGLDSSIVAAALAAAGAQFTAATFVTPGADGDERIFARAVARHCGAKLVELAHDDSQIELTAPPASLQPRPGAYGVLGGIDRAFEDAGFRREAAVFGGIGGDNVFSFDTSVAPILDAYERFGKSRRSLATARDVARAGNATLWDALRLALRARRAAPRGWRRDTSFCNAANLPAQPFAHPWDEGEQAALRGKRNHVAALRRILDFMDRPERWRDRDVVTPLLSQPLVEFCLSIPSWTWLTGGRDRAVARAAFARRLPAQVVWRRGKGRLETLCSAAYLAQRSQLRQLLLGGLLAERGLLDRAAIDAYLARDLRESDFDYLRLLEIADVERWARAASVPPFAAPSVDQR